MAPAPPRLRTAARHQACNQTFVGGLIVGLIVAAIFGGAGLHISGGLGGGALSDLSGPPPNDGGRAFDPDSLLAAARADADALRSALADARATAASLPSPPTPATPAASAPVPACPFCPDVPAAAFARGLERVAAAREAALHPSSCRGEPARNVRCWPERAAGHGPTGLTPDMVARGRKHVGNVHRFRRFLCKLWSGKPTTLLVVGGSNPTAAYAGRGNNFPQKIEAFLRRAFPVTQPPPPRAADAPVSDRGAKRGAKPEKGLEQLYRNHTVINRAAGGTGVCLTSQTVETFLDTWDVDVVLTEFAVNDGLDKWGRIKEINAVHPPCDAAYQPLRVCTEAFIRRVYGRNAHVAIIHLELASWKTQFAGVGSQPEISNFYQVPALSWRDAVLPAMRSRHGRFSGYEDWELVPCPNHGSSWSGRSTDSMWKAPSYLHRGANYSCRSVWHKDGNHMGPWGHAVAADLFFEMIAAESAAPRRLAAVPPARAPDAWSPKELIFFGKGEPVVHGTTVSAPAARIAAETRRPVYKTGTLSTPYAACHGEDLEHWGIRLMQKELYRAMVAGRTKAQVRRMCQFLPVAHSPGWRLFEDRPKKPGWIADARDASAAPEAITFELPLPPLNASGSGGRRGRGSGGGGGGYDLFLVFLKSYEKVGRFDVLVSEGGEERTKMVDALWERQRSTFEEEAVGRCAGPCNVTIATRAPMPGRGGNKVKVVSLRAVLAT